MGCGSSRVAADLNTGGDVNVNLRSVIIWSAEGLQDEAFWKSDSRYCVARVGSQGCSWDEKLRGNGRRSCPVHEAVTPKWSMGFTIDVHGMENPEVQVRIYAQDWTSWDEFCGEAIISLEALAKAAAPQDIPLVGKHAQGKVRVSAGPVSILAEHDIKPNSFFQELGPLPPEKSVKVEDITGDGPIRLGTAPLPETMHGIFWLTKQGTGSALASFGGPTSDGAGCSAGRLSGTTYRIRCNGDRVWANAERCSHTTLMAAVDLCYIFVFDDEQNPTRVQIYLEVGSIGYVLKRKDILDFEGFLMKDGDPEYPGSVVWRRQSWVLGKACTGEGDYALVQVIDGKGTRLEPAWSKFVEYQKSSETGTSPGVVWYRAAEDQV